MCLLPAERFKMETKMTKEQIERKAQALKDMAECVASGGGEIGHMNADTILCEFLVALGHEDLVELYDSMPGMWYA